MAALPATPLPSLSQIQAWPIEHLAAAADSWTTTARTWDDAFTAVYRQAPAPGGTPWDGQTADAAIQRVGADRLKVLGAVDSLHDAAAIARNAIADIQSARRLALQAVAEAQAAGFTVGEDLSVTSRHVAGPPARQAARMTQAPQLSAIIRSRAVELVAIEDDIAARITAAAGGLQGIHFTDSPSVPLAWGPSGVPPPEGRVICTPTPGGFACSEFLPNGFIYHWLSPVDFTGHWPN
jgi:hypothetical protein